MPAQVDLQPLVCLSDPLSAAEPSVTCKITAGWRANTTPELTPVQWRLAKCLTPWGAVTCFPLNSSINLTGPRFEFSVLALPINSSHTVRFQAPFLLILDCCLCGTAPHWGNYWGCVGRIKFLIKERAVLSLLLPQPPLRLLQNRRCSGASSSFHSYLQISSDIFQGWFSCCFRDIYLASSSCLLLEKEQTREKCQKCDSISRPLFTSTSPSPHSIFTGY